MSDSEIITATEASRAFSDVLHKVAYQGQSFVIKKGNRMMAKIVPVDEEISQVPQKKSAKKIQEKRIESPAPKPQEKVQTISASKPKQTTTAKTSSGTSVPEGLTSEDVDFYQKLISNMGQGS